MRIFSVCKSKFQARIAVVAAALLVSLLVAVPSAWAQEITVTLRVEYLEATMVPPTEVTLQWQDWSAYGIPGTDPGFITPLHVLAEGMMQFGGTTTPPAIAAPGGFLSTINGSSGSNAGAPNTFWMFAANQAMPTNPDAGWGFSTANYPVQNGDAIDILGMWSGDWMAGVSPYLSFFDSASYIVQVGQPLELTLLGLDGFNDFNVPPTTPLAGATILADSATAGTLGATTATSAVTGADGVTLLSFDTPGTFVISATRSHGTTIDITRPFATVTVSSADPGPGPNLPVSAWDSFRGNAHNSAVVTAPTPTSPQSAVAAWRHPVSSGNSALSPVIVGDNIFIAGGTSLWKFNPAGQALGTATLAEPTGVASFLAAGSGMVFVPLGSGAVQAFDATTLAPVWTSSIEGFGADWSALGTLTYRDGFLYGSAGMDIFAQRSEGMFFCLDVNDGSRVWTYSSTSAASENGFYWSGAAVTESAALFAGDDGVLVSHSAGTAAGSPAVIDTRTLPGGVRSPVLFVSDGTSGAGTAYVATRNGYVARVTVAANGTFTSTVSTARLTGSGSTSTPVMYRDRLFVVSGELLLGGHVDVFNAATLERLRTVALPGTATGGFSQSSPLLSTAGASAANGHEVNLFVALNSSRDDVIRITDASATTAGAAALDSQAIAARNTGTITAESIYRPGGSFTLSSLTAGADGTLFYVDGSGNFTALSTSSQPVPMPDDPPNGSDNGSGSDDANEDNSGENDNNNGTDVQAENEEDAEQSDQSTTTTRTATVGPKTYDMNVGGTAFFLIGAIALMLAVAAIAKIIDDRRNQQMDNLEEYSDDNDDDHTNH